jgi:hypothetical protein
MNNLNSIELKLEMKYNKKSGIVSLSNETVVTKIFL